MSFTDFTGLLAALGIFITAIVGLLNLLQSRANGRQAAGTHELINSRMSELLNASTGQAHAEGVAAGEQAQRDRQSPGQS